MNNSATFPIIVLPFGVSVLCGGVVGVLGNTAILFAVFRPSSPLKSSCYRLMAQLAVADNVSSLGFIVYGLLVLLGYSWGLSNWECFLLNIPFILSFNAGCFLILVVGIDRLLAISIPIKYERLSRKPVYINGMVAVSWLYSLPFLIVGYFASDPLKVVPTCVLPTSLNEEANQLWALSNVLVNILVIIVYFLVTIKARGLHSTGQRCRRLQREAKKVFRSLILVMLIYVGSWGVTMGTIFLLVVVLRAGDSLVFHGSLYVGILANVNVASNFFVYSLRSEEYRKVFRRFVPFFFSEQEGGRNNYLFHSGLPSNNVAAIEEEPLNSTQL